MSYFTFLFIFVGIPIAIFWFLNQRSQTKFPVELASFAPLTVLLTHVIIAVTYTTPWDNYLVATEVWWYDPDLVTGIVIGWVPIEEYTFFVVQPILAGLFLFWLIRRFTQDGTLPTERFVNRPNLRRNSFAAVFILWFIVTILLFSGNEPTTYLSLEFSWALLPVMLQIGYGADILWHFRRLVGWAIAIPTLYLSAADAIAIGAGTWTISPTQSLDFHLFGVLPVEEFLFFLLTNILLVFGCTLFLSAESYSRLLTYKERYLTANQASKINRASN